MTKFDALNTKMYKKYYNKPIAELSDCVPECVLASSFNPNDNTEYVIEDYGGLL